MTIMIGINKYESFIRISHHYNKIMKLLVSWGRKEKTKNGDRWDR